MEHADGARASAWDDDLAGCQIRYPVGSAHGWLGAAGFSAAALRVSARDRWMAWSEEQRREHPNRVVCLSRFLIRPSVRCPHLASHVLGRMLRRLPRDFETRYGFRPWLVESFADAGDDCTCLRAAYPGQKIHANSASDSTAINAFYRLIGMPAESAVTVENILAPHRERSVQRIRARRTVLAIQDGTDLNFATRPGCDGLQLIGKNQTGAKSLGLHLHATMAVTDTGLPLGMLRLGFDPLEKRPAAAEARRKTLRWLDGFTDIARAVREVGGKTRVISVCDREADVFELFDGQRRSARVDLLVARSTTGFSARGSRSCSQPCAAVRPMAGSTSRWTG